MTCRMCGTAAIFPADTWSVCSPAEVGLSAAVLGRLRELVGGRGCVVRHGHLAYTWGDVSLAADIASAMKPVISTLLLAAVQEGRLDGVDAPVATFEPQLRMLNSGKDGGITWRHLASQTSGYGLVEAPGAAYAYNDYALALYYDALMQGVFAEDGTQVLRTRLGDALGFEDAYTFDALGRPDRLGRLAISVRDLARFGMLYLHGGEWRGRQVVAASLIAQAIGSPLPADTPLASGREAPMLPCQRSIGGGKNQTATGPGYYSFNWWLNGLDRQGRRLFVDAPANTYVASGHGGKRTLWVMPGLDLIVCWNESAINDHDASPGNPDTLCNRAARLMVEMTE